MRHSILECLETDALVTQRCLYEKTPKAGDRPGTIYFTTTPLSITNHNLLILLLAYIIIELYKKVIWCTFIYTFNCWHIQTICSSVHAHSWWKIPFPR